MKPDWKDAPEWANWLALDDDGDWVWHESRPRRNPAGDDGTWYSTRCELAFASGFKSVQERPQ